MTDDKTSKERDNFWLTKGICKKCKAVADVSDEKICDKCERITKEVN